MVKICSETYPAENEERFKEHFEMFPYGLSPFQKHSIEALVSGHHSLVLAHTGAGKSTPFEFAAEYFIKMGKKVIYCSPIKSLSNQKFSDFTQKYPHISVGIVTGDICVNKEASLLILTTEILCNTLFLKKNIKNEHIKNNNASLLSFDMDFDNELGCVVFDEFHYLNDPDRGHVWENTVMMLPHHIQMLMLSATLDKPNKIATWIEARPSPLNMEDSVLKKDVYISSTNNREVPLTHYSFITTTQGIFKAIKDKEMEKEINNTINKLHLIQNEKGVFNEPIYHKIQKMLTLFEQKQVYVKRSHVINQVCKYLVENSLLPAICFVLSRKQLEVCAMEVTTILLEDDSKVGYIASREAEKILRKLPNFQEYLELPEYIKLISLLEKGIGIHHAGMVSIFREIVEIFLTRGYIKLLFCTETFALGVNFPIKTTIFTDVKKFDGSQTRMLYAHEYTQQSGRAGRRGYDKVGTVIHLNNLFRNVELTEYRLMMHGKPQTLVSKFKISYNLLLSLIDSGDNNILEFCQRSMIQEDIESELTVMKQQLDKSEAEANAIKNGSLAHIKTPKEVVEQYLVAVEKRKTSVNKKRKELDREIQNIVDAHKTLLNDVISVTTYNEKVLELEKYQKQYRNTNEYLNGSINTLLDFLKNDGFISENELTPLGFIATHFREAHCLVFSRLYASNKFNNLSAIQMVAIFSCFTNVTVSDEQKTILPDSNDTSVKKIVQEITEMYNYYQDFETNYMTNTGVDYNIHYDLIDYVIRWCNCDSAPECKFILQNLESEKTIFLGEFVKAILKINNMASEMEKIAESVGDIALLHKLKEIPVLTLKFVATNQSLYV
jgi:superfamily II RNA helicase